MSTAHKSKYKGGSILRGTPEDQRHLFDWDLGKGLGMHCRKCGLPKPPWTADETMCIGHHLASKADLLVARGDSMPNYLLSLAWARMLKENQVEMNPAFILASKAAFKAPLAKFGMVKAREQAQIVGQDATLMYQAVPADVEAYRHHIACCYAIAKLVNLGKLTPNNQAVLQAVAIIREADSSEAVRNYTQHTAQQMAGDMIRQAQKLGYYGGKASNLVPA